MHIQRFRGHTVLNSHPFGRALQSFGRTRIAPFAEVTQFGFQDGGCLMFAMALRDWSEGNLKLSAVYSSTRGLQAQHVVATLAGDVPLYLDSDGVGTEYDILAKGERFDWLEGGYVDAYCEIGESTIPRDDSLIADLALRLGRRFGPFNSDLFATFEWPSASCGPRR